MLRQLGSVGRSYRRDQRGGFKRLVSEIYSPPRITAELRKRKSRYLLPGFALDFTVIDEEDGQPWDFSKEEKRAKALRLVRTDRPYLLIGSPMCRAFSTWQRLNELRCRDPEALARARQEAETHIEFVAMLYHEQIQGGRYFLHEHPKWATSWELKCMKELQNIATVGVVQGDQCQFGSEAKSGPHRGQPVKKPTGFMSNSPKLLEALGRRCTGRNGECSRPGGGRHALCSGPVAVEAAIYPRDLCKTVLSGISAQLRTDNRLKPGCFGIQAVDEDAEVHASMYGPDQGYSGRYHDDLTGQVLKDKLVTAARFKELEFFHSKGVWIKAPKNEARHRTGRPPITVRWVDVNKGDEVSPNYRSRLVARQMKCHDRSGASYFAPAPPLEALRTVLSLAVTTVGSHCPILDPDSPQ